MPIIRFMPNNKSVQVKQGTSILEAARRARVSIRTRCDGKASCLMCKVNVEDAAGLTPMQGIEALKLEGALPQVRLACQAKCVAGEIEVWIPEDPLKELIRRKLMEQRDDSL